MPSFYNIRTLLVFAVVLSPATAQHDNSSPSIYIHFSNVTSQMDDEKLMIAMRLEQDEIYITSFVPELDATKVHHLGVHGCFNADVSTSKPDSELGLCFSGSRFLFAWADNAPSFTFPKDVSFPAGTKTQIRYFTLTVHYKSKFSDPDSSGMRIFYKKERTRYTAGMLTLFPPSFESFSLKPGFKEQSLAWVCPGGTVLNEKVYAFALRGHAHYYSRAAGVFRQPANTTKWLTVAEKSPQRPQTFHLLEKPVELRASDALAARCVYDTSTAEKVISGGPNHDNEMCALYIMFYVSHSDVEDASCSVPKENLNDGTALGLPAPDKKELAVPVAANAGDQGEDEGNLQRLKATRTTKLQYQTTTNIATTTTDPYWEEDITETPAKGEELTLAPSHGVTGEMLPSWLLDGDSAEITSKQPAVTAEVVVTPGTKTVIIEESKDMSGFTFTLGIFAVVGVATLLLGLALFLRRRTGALTALWPFKKAQNQYRLIQNETE